MIAASERQSVVDLCQSLARRGYLAGTGGNVALRLDSAHILVTPSATDYFALKAEDICVLRMADLQQMEGTLAPSVESDLHRRVFQRRPDCNCSLHTHQPVASACALLGRSLLVAPGPRRELLGEMAVLVGYAPSGTKWLASKLAAAVRPEIQAYLMRNHGVLCCGADVSTAVAALEALEEEAKEYLGSQIRGRIEKQPSVSDKLAGVLAGLENSV